MQQEAPDDFVDSLQPVLNAAVEGLTIVFAGPPTLLVRAHSGVSLFRRTGLALVEKESIVL